MPSEVIARLNHELNKALQTAEMKQRFPKIGAEPMVMSPGQFERLMREE
jgi:tripartite-type tricarboxylate transporter receptor subunit TctC